MNGGAEVIKEAFSHVQQSSDNNGCHGMKKSVIQTVFVLCVQFILLVPIVCMPFVTEDVSQEKRDLAETPWFFRDGQINLHVLADAGNYFTDHFAFRSTLVDIDATLKQCLGTSSTDSIVLGSKGWLYYSGTLPDYQRTNLMSEHALHNAARNIALIQESVESRGKQFVIVIAPNKNSIYPECMPYYQLAGEKASNYERLHQLLIERGVHIVDLHVPLSIQSELLYYERDTHWNEEGAIKAYLKIGDSLGGWYPSYETSHISSAEHLGDLDGMLHPVFACPEVVTHRLETDSYSITNDSNTVEDSYIVTSSTRDSAQNSLVMYRDSFGNNLLPPFACAYRHAAFTKLVPYDLTDQMIGFADDVVIERAERHLSFFATTPPYLYAPERKISSTQELVTSTSTISCSRAQQYLIVEGVIDSSVADMSDHIFVELYEDSGVSKVYEAFYVSELKNAEMDSQVKETSEAARDSTQDTGDWGYRVYVPAELFEESHQIHSRILVGDNSACREVAHADLLEREDHVG